MRLLRSLLLVGTASLSSAPALAAETVQTGPIPSWVHPQAIPAAKPSDAPVAVLLKDEQTSLSPGKVSTFQETAFKVLKSEGLAAGNLSLVWQPATETMTVHKLHIIRDGKIIDVLANGQTFTVLRRETNLDAATLDGSLTATIQPEGLQEGDIIDLAATIDHSDPVLKGHVEAMFGAWAGVPIQLAHAALQWPTNLHLQLRESSELPSARRSSAGGLNQLELTGHDVQPLVPPKQAPARFKIGRLAEATDYSNWSDVADLMMPLYRSASVIPSSGALHDEVEKIRSASKDPLVRATQALALVQDRVRYVALLMGQGGYVPAPAEQTWSRRFGDCKAKTALLLGILRSLDVAAEPVMVGVGDGDAIGERLPSISLFNHVLVRAHIAARDYWLDGTRSGDTDLKAIETPDFGWGLPLAEHSALVHLQPAPLAEPNVERFVNIDASKGVYADAPITISEVYRGDVAIAGNSVYTSATAAQRDAVFHDKAVNYFDGFHVEDSAFQFDKTKRLLTLTIKGTAKLNWKDGWYFVPTSSIAYDPDFDRSPGPNHDAPLAIDYPSFVKDRAVIRLPAGFAATQKLIVPTHETLVGTEFTRSENMTGDTITVDSSERTIAPEVAYKDALAGEQRLRTLNKDDVYLHVPDGYRGTATDLDVLAKTSMSSANEYFQRAQLLANSGKLDAALTDVDAGLKLDPNSDWGLGLHSDLKTKKKDFRAAEADVDKIEKLSGADGSTMRGRGWIAENKGDRLTAAEWYGKAIKADPDDIFSLVHRGQMLVALGRSKEALEPLNSALTIEPKNTLALMNRAMAALNQGDFVAAERDAKLVVSIAPSIPAAYLVQGTAAEARHDLPTAIDFYTKANDLAKSRQGTPRYTDPLYRRANAYLALAQYDKALADADELAKASDSTVDARLLRTNILVERGDRGATLSEAAKIIAENPKDDYAFVAAAKIYAAAGQRDKAMTAFERALAIHNYAYIYLNRAQVRPATDWTGRLADLDAGLKVEPDNADLITTKAQILMDKGDLKAALATLTSPKTATTDKGEELERAIVLAKLGRKDEAEKLLQGVRASATKGQDYNELCWEPATANLFLEEALKDCQKAVSLEPANGAFADSLGMALLKLNRLDEALSAYNKAIERRTGAASLMGRAFVYLRKGDHRHADLDAAAARRLVPSIDDDFAEYGLEWAGKEAKPPSLPKMASH